MKTEYDKKIDAKYIRIKGGKIARTKRETDWLFFDYSKDEEIVGIEILNASKHKVNISALLKKSFSY